MQRINHSLEWIDESFCGSMGQWRAHDVLFEFFRLEWSGLDWIGLDWQEKRFSEEGWLNRK